MASFSKLEIMFITLQVILALVDRGEGGGAGGRGGWSPLLLACFNQHLPEQWPET